MEAYDYEPEFKTVRVIRFKNLDQYEIVCNNIEEQSIEYKTFYFWKGDYLTLDMKEQIMNAFSPSETTLQEHEIAAEAEKNPSLANVIRVVKSHPYFQDPIQYIIIRQKTRYLVEYAVYFESEMFKGEFYLIENLKNSKVTIVDLISKEKLEMAEETNEEKIAEELVGEVIEES